MRTREEIIELARKVTDLGQKVEVGNNALAVQNDLILEVLLDIRELLGESSRPK